LKKLAIVGSGANTRDKAPWDDPTFDIWVFNESGNHPWCKRWSAVFQMHEPEIYTGHNTKDPAHWEWLQQSHGKPIYMQEADPRVPDAVAFPLGDAIALSGEDYFASTFAYMAAQAILEGYEVIHIHGIELSFSEYQYQADCWRYWIGFLKGRLGAENVILHSGQHLFQSPRYGYEGNFAFGSDFFAERAGVLEAQWSAADKNLRNLKKAIDRAVANKEHQKVQDLVIQYRDACISTGELSGALSEAQRYQTFGDRYADRGGFEYAAAKAQRDGEARKPLIWHLGGMIEYAWNAWKQTDAQRAKDQMYDLIGRMSATAEGVGALLGMYNENISYIMKYDAIAKAGGGVLLEEAMTA
jgi:hypothetical protein